MNVELIALCIFHVGHPVGVKEPIDVKRADERQESMSRQGRLGTGETGLWMWCQGYTGNCCVYCVPASESDFGEMPCMDKVCKPPAICQDELSELCFLVQS